MKTVLIVAALATSWAGAASAAGRWQVEPNEADYRALLPAAAKAENVGGRAIARCRLTTAGETSGCVVLRETPTGYGFGQAALEIAKKYRAAPQAAESIVELSYDCGRWTCSRTG